MISTTSLTTSGLSARAVNATTRIRDARATTTTKMTTTPTRRGETRAALFNFGGKSSGAAGSSTQKANVKGYKDAGSGTQKRVMTKPFSTTKKVVSKPKPKPKPMVKAKTMKKVVKPIVKKPIVKKPIVKKPIAQKPIATKVVRKPLLNAKPRPAVKKAPVRRPAPVRRAPKPINTNLTLQQTADLGYAGILAGSGLLALAILPSVADVALETIGIAYTLYFTYNYLLFEESRDEFKATLEDIESGTGINIPAIFDGITSAVSDVTSKVNSSSKPKAYPKKTETVVSESAEEESSSEE
jgi:hypothetical protein